MRGSTLEQDFGLCDWKSGLRKREKQSAPLKFERSGQRCWTQWNWNKPHHWKLGDAV